MPRINFQIESSILSELASTIVLRILGDNPQLKKVIQVKRFVSEELAVDKYFGISGKEYYAKKDKNLLFRKSYQQMEGDEKKLFQIWQIEIPDELVTPKMEILNSIPLPEFIKNLKGVPGVSFVSLDKTYQLASPSNEPRYPEQYGLSIIECKPAWEISQGQGILIAVIDSGIHKSHRDISARIATDQAGNIIGRNFTSTDLDDLTDNASNGGHGTHMSGIIAADENQKGIVGVAPKAKILPLKAFKYRQTSNSKLLAEAMYYAEFKGAHIINNSWYFAGNSIYLDLSDEAEDFGLYSMTKYVINKKVTCVFAAGNNGDEIPNYWLINEPDAIVVAASNEKDELYEYSNWSEKITIAAPGESILSLKNDGNAYFKDSGTSMATAHVSGAIALYLAKMGGNRIHANLIKSRLRDSAHSDEIETGGIETAGGLRLNCHKFLL